MNLTINVLGTWLEQNIFYFACSNEICSNDICSNKIYNNEVCSNDVYEMAVM